MARNLPPHRPTTPICGADARYPSRVKRVKLIWLAVLAAFALTATAVTATSASAAEPEWGHCVAAKKGFYSDSNCTTRDEKKGKPKGKFEWAPGAQAACFAQKHGHYEDSSCTKEKFKEKNGVKSYKGKYEKTGGPKFAGEGGAGVLRTELYQCNTEESAVLLPHADCTAAESGFEAFFEATVECATEHATGEATGADEVANVSVRFTGCTSFGEPATTHGLPAGEIQTETLKGRLGYINKATHAVGVLLEPATSGGQFAEFEVFEGQKIDHVGAGNAAEGAFYEQANGTPSGNDGIISPVVPVNQMTHTFTQNYRIEKIEPYEPASCAISHTCPHGNKNFAEEPAKDFLNVPSHFEGGPAEALENYLANENLENGTGSWSPAGQEITNVNTVEGEAEIKG